MSLKTVKDNRIVAAISGGVDSAVCAALLKSAGYDVSCVYFVFSSAGENGAKSAAELAKALALPFEIADVRREFENIVVADFCSEYCAGRTPNPCVICNPLVKFAALCRHADRLGIDKIATGHYARIETMNGHSVLRKAASAARDQSYMLHRLTQEQLSRLLLPLGPLEKSEVRATASKMGLACADAPDSQEICFIPDGDYPAYINKRGFRGKQGRFISPDGEPLGLHAGVERYTIGQRSGLGVSFGEAVYIKRILENGDIELCRSGKEYSDGVVVRNAAISPAFEVKAGLRFDVKLRSAAKPAPCEAVSSDGDGFVLKFDTPQRAPAPGQSAVLYSGEYVAGGGFIESCF